jgi:hypothetical protein
MPKAKRKPQGRALTIGLDSLDPGVERYAWLNRLHVAEADAKYIGDITDSRGFVTETLLGKKATRDAVKARFSAAAKALRAGDIFLLSFSGHGDWVADTNKDEADHRDETWCLYDGEIVDDKLFKLWAKFKRGVRIFVLSDSCRSGTILGADLFNRRRRRTKRRKKVKASVLLISACQDNELAFEDDSNSILVDALKRVWKGGRFRGTYKGFCDRIGSEMRPRGERERQTPNYGTVGTKNSAFEGQKPFTI